MAEATAPETHADEALVLSLKTASHTASPSLFQHKRLLFALWVAFAIFIVGFLSLGIVRVGAGNWIGRRLSVVRIWKYFLDFLADKGATAPMIAGVAVVALLAALSAIYLLWLAFRLQDERETNEPMARTAGD